MHEPLLFIFVQAEFLPNQPREAGDLECMIAGVVVLWGYGIDQDGGSFASFFPSRRQVLSGSAGRIEFAKIRHSRLIPIWTERPSVVSAHPIEPSAPQSSIPPRKHARPTIHPSSWNRNSRKFISTILHSLTPIPMETPAPGALHSPDTIPLVTSMDRYARS